MNIEVIINTFRDIVFPILGIPVAVFLVSLIPIRNKDR